MNLEPRVRDAVKYFWSTRGNCLAKSNGWRSKTQRRKGARAQRSTLSNRRGRSASRWRILGRAAGESAGRAATQEDCAFSRGSPKDAAEGRPCPRTERNLFASLRPCVLASLRPCVLASLRPCVLVALRCSASAKQMQPENDKPRSKAEIRGKRMREHGLR